MTNQKVAEYPRSGARVLPKVGIILLLCAAIFSTQARADFEFPRLSAGMGVGFGGIYHKDYVAGTYEGTHFGGKSSGLSWAGLSCAYPSRLMFGCRLHLLRIDLEGESGPGTFDIMPIVLQVGYYHPFAKDRLLGFVSIGAGTAWTRFRPGDRVDDWQAREGGRVEISESHPFVFEFDLGLGYRLHEDFLIESHLTSVLMDATIYYEGESDPEDGSTFKPEYAYEAMGRHMMATVGLRWWFEWW